MKSRQMSRRKLLRFAAIGSSTLVLAACQPKVVEKIVEQTVVVTEEKVVKETVQVEVEKAVEVTKIVEKVTDRTLLRWHHRLGTEWSMYTAATQVYEEEHPNIRVHEEVVPATDAEYAPKMLTMIVGGVAGDIAWVCNAYGAFQFFAVNNAIVPFDDLIDADGTGFSLDEYFVQAVDMFRLADNVGDGPLYALPELAQALHAFLFFNKDIFASKGVDLPTDEWTRDQMLEAALRLTDDNHYGYYGVVKEFKNQRNHTLPYGVDMFSADGKQSLLEDEAVKDATRWVIDLFAKHRVAPRTQDMEGSDREMFAAGKLAMIQHPITSWGAFQGLVKDFEWDMVVMPKGPVQGLGSRGGWFSGDGESILADSELKQEAYEFIKAITSRESQVQLALEIGLAARPDVFEESRTKDQPQLRRSRQMLEEAAPFLSPWNLRQLELNTVTQAIFQPAFAGEIEADDTFFTEASEQLQKFLDKPRE